MTSSQNDQRTRCEIWTRVMGYHRPVTSWNPGKQQEHADRKFFRESQAQADPRPALPGDTYA